MKLSRFITLVVLAGVLALILSACGARPRPVEETTIALAPTTVLPSATPATDRHTDGHAQRHAAADCFANAHRDADQHPHRRRRLRRPQPRRRIRCRWSIMREQSLSRQRHRDRAEASGRGELPALSRFVPLRGVEAVRPADGAQRDAAGDRLAGDRLQPRLHPAGAVPDHRALRRVRGWVRPQRLRRFSARLPRSRQIGRECVRGVRLARLHDRRAECAVIRQAVRGRRSRTASGCGATPWAATSHCVPWSRPRTSKRA